MKIELFEETEAILKHYKSVSFFSLKESADILMRRGWLAITRAYGVTPDIQRWDEITKRKFCRAMQQELESVILKGGKA